jgi:hypothetical protein
LTRRSGVVSCYAARWRRRRAPFPGASLFGRQAPWSRAQPGRLAWPAGAGAAVFASPNERGGHRCPRPAFRCRSDGSPVAEACDAASIRSASSPSTTSGSRIPTRENIHRGRSDAVARDGSATAPRRRPHRRREASRHRSSTTSSATVTLSAAGW